MKYKLDSKKIEKYKKTHIPQKCEMCGGGSWLLEEEVLFLPTVKTGTLIPSSSGYPFVPVVCPKCGNTKFVNALIADLGNVMEDEEEKYE